MRLHLLGRMYRKQQSNPNDQANQSQNNPQNSSVETVVVERASACPWCGSNLDDGNQNYCQNCGSKI